jgi:hypothetical protein
MTASGWNSARALTGGLQVCPQVVRSNGRRLDPLLRRACKRSSDQGSVDPLPDRRRELQSEPSGVEQLQHAVEARHHRPTLDPSDGGLRDSGFRGECPLGQTGSTPGVSDGARCIHAVTITDLLSSDSGAFGEPSEERIPWDRGGLAATLIDCIGIVCGMERTTVYRQRVAEQTIAPFESGRPDLPRRAEDLLEGFGEP